MSEKFVPRNILKSNNNFPKSLVGLYPKGEILSNNNIIHIKTSSFLDLLNNKKLKFPAVYKITDIQNGLFVNTLSANTFSNEASLSFLAPDYTLHAQYHHTDGAIANNAIVTWGGFYWQNTSGGSATPDLPNEGTISTNGFTKITKSVANGYVPIILAVTIQVAQGTIYIVSAKDDRDNYIEQSIAAQISLPFIPLEVNQWNNLTIFGNKVLVCNNVVYFNTPMDFSSIYSNSGTFSFTSEIPFLISIISQNKLTGQGATIKGNVIHTRSIIYRNTLSGLSNSIHSNYLTSFAEIQGNVISGTVASIEGYQLLSLSTISSNVLSGNPSANGGVKIAYGTLDDDSHLNGNTLSGDGAQFFDNHQHEACEINGNTLSGDNTRISHVIQIKTDKCNNNTISADNELIDMVFQDGTLCELNNNTITAGKSIENLRMSNSQIVNSTVKIKELTVQGIAIDLTGFTTDIDGETYQNGGWFTITHNFATSPLHSGSSVLYNIIPKGAAIVSLSASGSLTGITLEIGLETDDEGIISGNVGLLPLSWSGFSNAATGNRSLKIKAVGGNITAGSLTVKIEFVL